jgi:hypothetical protein
LQPDAIRYDIFRFVSNVALFQKFVSELREWVFSLSSGIGSEIFRNWILVLW